MSKECNNVYINSFLVLYIVSCFSIFKPWGRIDILRSYCASTRHAASSMVNKSFQKLVLALLCITVSVIRCARSIKTFYSSLHDKFVYKLTNPINHPIGNALTKHSLSA